jgi:hypothetical protein
MPPKPQLQPSDGYRMDAIKPDFKIMYGYDLDNRLLGECITQLSLTLINIGLSAVLRRQRLSLSKTEKSTTCWYRF